MLCVQIYCELRVFGLLSDELSTVNTGLGRSMFWKRLSLLNTPEGMATTNYQSFTPKVAHSVKSNPKVSEALSELLISSFISSKPRQHSVVFHNVLVVMFNSQCIQSSETG